ncbi:hypothetical protein IQ241_02815 [Romeria aff. gracilis LEGE 07310]|uniref:Uncharacterized protein n=1 Tax=Vasconcelosia minhoensis LEGE 07310 TaxID=915328 RepID=A0A8J7DAB6_9CYAN|nr:hypothetical protein [Romeria gracilis]MBE9076237.1 hypothetical protein [Romeria aff. gracilis LEGE 07310]
MDTTTVKGTIQWMEMGSGTWAVVTDEGQTYELHGDTASLEKKGLKVQIEGAVRKDVMSMSMIGPILEVKSYEILSES